jgi:hypothetical protein
MVAQMPHPPYSVERMGRPHPQTSTENDDGDRATGWEIANFYQIDKRKLLTQTTSSVV